MNLFNCQLTCEREAFCEWNLSSVRSSTTTTSSFCLSCPTLFCFLYCCCHLIYCEIPTLARVSNKRQKEESWCCWWMHTQLCHYYYFLWTLLIHTHFCELVSVSVVMQILLLLFAWNIAQYAATLNQLCHLGLSQKWETMIINNCYAFMWHFLISQVGWDARANESRSFWILNEFSISHSIFSAVLLWATKWRDCDSSCASNTERARERHGEKRSHMENENFQHNRVSRIMSSHFGFS